MKLTQRLLLATALCAAISSAYAEIPNTSSPSTFLGPVVKGSYTDRIYDKSAYSVLGEVGPKNYRVGATLGFIVEDDNYLKFSAEYLGQKITYAFLTGDTNEWVFQGALGAAYEYDMHGSRDARFNIDGYMSYAPSKGLSDASATYYLGATPTTFSEGRRIAGSFAAGVSPGLSMLLWDGGRATIAGNYDNVRYDKNNSPMRSAIGVGGTAGLEQSITEDTELDMSAALRAPFNHYEATFLINNIPNLDGWILGLNGGYTSGKETLPNTWTVLVTADYQVDQSYERKFIHPSRDARRHRANDHLIAWTGKPAVYMPQVLAVTDETAQCNSRYVRLSGVPFTSPVYADVYVLQSFPTAQSFTPSSGLNYSVTTSPSPLLSSNKVTINPTTGVVSVKPTLTQDFTYTVTATNDCGASVTGPPTLISVQNTA